MADSRCSINLLGTSFQIQTDQDPEYLEELISYLRCKIEEVDPLIPGKDPLKIALLSAILVVDELFREQRSRGDAVSEDEARKAGELAEKLIEHIDKILEDK